MRESSSTEPDLGLSLDLGLTISLPPHPDDNHLLQTTTASARRDDLQLNFRTMPCLVAPVSSDADRNSETQAFHLGNDVNRPPLGSTECEEEAGVYSPNSTVSSISGKQGDRETNGEDPENQPAFSHGLSDEEDGENCRKKMRLSKEQSATLEEAFREHNTLNPKQKLALAKQLGLRPRQVEVWFQNRRARTKLKQTEVDCEFLKRCCENLKEENRRLQKEVRELRALRLLPPQFYMHLSPPTTLTACPSCDHRNGTVPVGMSSTMPVARDL